MDSQTNKPSTEGRNPASHGFDALSSLDAVRLMHSVDMAAFEAIKPALEDIARASEQAAEAIRGGGRVWYTGAGTSGRLAVLDATEVRPTFGSNAFGAVMAGGNSALTEAVEGAEDDRDAGEAEAKRVIKQGDMALGVTASGRTPFVMGFLQGAKPLGATAWLIRCTDVDEPVPDKELDGIITLPTGAEVIAGSTRLKAGTATKMALNMISTVALSRLGGSYDGLMVDVMPTNHKLVERATGIIMEITGANRDKAEDALREADMSPKAASLMLMRSIGRDEALEALKASGGSLRGALRSTES